MPDLPYRLCAFDLDDTLLTPQHTLSPRTIATLSALQKQNVALVLASGRMTPAMKKYQNTLHLHGPVIAYNGAMVRDPDTGDTWLEEQIAPGLAQPILDYCQQHDLQLNFYQHDILYSHAMTDWLHLYQERTGAPIELRPDFYDAMRGQTPTKLVIVDSEPKTNALLPDFQQQYGDRLYITKSAVEYLEFMPATASKGKALAIVAERLGVPQAQTIAFGDSWNDVPMLQWAGLGLAVANAKQPARDAADRLIGSNTDDGPARELQSLFHLTI